MITKEKSAKGRAIKVTFAIPADSVREQAAVAGDFNDWSETKNPMKYDKKTNQWTCAVSLKPNASYRFRYLVDGEWRNDAEADSYEPSPYFSENSVVDV